MARELKRIFKHEREKLKAFVCYYLSSRYYQVDPEDIIQDVAVNMFAKVNFYPLIEN
jgi:DNA-directed RNA polymerase specialized sigma24 family protein